MLIYIDSFLESHKAQSIKLTELAKSLNEESYKIVKDPLVADIILLCDAIFDNNAFLIRVNFYLRNYPDKCFVLSNEDRPITFFRGIYTSAEKKNNNFGRIRSGSYTAYYDAFRNPFIYRTETNPTEYNIKKLFLFSFIGRNSHPVRDVIFNLKFFRDDIFLEDTTNSYDLYSTDNRDDSKEKKYYDTILESKFTLCPRGWGTNSIRLFESMKLGVAPIIISDEWVFPRGIDWAEFSIIIKSKDLNKLESIVTGYEYQYEEMGRKAKHVYDKYFSDKNYFLYIIQNCIEIKKNQILPEKFFFKISLIIHNLYALKSLIFSKANAFLKSLKTKL